MLLGALHRRRGLARRRTAAVAATGLTGWRLTAERVRHRTALTATRVRIEVDDDATERPAAQLITMAARTGLPVAEARARPRSRRWRARCTACRPPTSTCTSSAGTTP